MKALRFGLGLCLLAISVSSTSFSAEDGKTTRSRIKRKPLKPVNKLQNNEGVQAIEKHAMEIEGAHEDQERQNFEHLLHVFEGYIQRLSGEPFTEHDLKVLHDAFHALTPAQKETFFQQFSEGKVEAHIIEKLKLLYQQFPKPHHG